MPEGIKLVQIVLSHPSLLQKNIALVLIYILYVEVVLTWDCSSPPKFSSATSPLPFDPSNTSLTLDHDPFVTHDSFEMYKLNSFITQALILSSN